MKILSVIVTTIFLLVSPACNRVSKSVPPHYTTPKNVVLIIVDGMGMSEMYAGYTANKGHLYIDEADYIGISKTYSADNYITDSAASGTAMACGEKTNNGVIGLNAAGDTITSILELAEMKGMATGLLSTSKITHATPASYIAHVASRGQYQDIAADFLITNIDLFIGGGSEDFETREDGRDLLEELNEKGYTVAIGLDSTLLSTKLPLAGFTAVGHNPKYREGRGDMLPKATKHALNLLSANPNGFFVMIEAAQVDWGGHANDSQYIIDEMLDADKVLGVALEFAKTHPETLVILTADHETGGLTLLGGNMETGELVTAFSATHHTAVPVPVFAFGCGAESFAGVYENTELFHKMVKLLELNRFQMF